MDNAEGLMGASQNLASAAEKSARANIQIGLSISGIRDDMDEQQSSVSDTENRLEKLNRTMETMKASLDSYTELVRKMSASPPEARKKWTRRSGKRRAENGDRFDRACARLLLGKTGLGERFRRVIEGLAESTNVLAINAADTGGPRGNGGKIVRGGRRGNSQSFGEFPNRGGKYPRDGERHNRFDG